MNAVGRIAMSLALACAAPYLAAVEESAAANQAETVEEILRADPDQSDYGTAEKCIRSQRIVRTRVLSNRHILFELPRGERWLVTLPMPCPELRPGAKLAFERSGPRLCEFDDVRVLIETGLDTARLGPTCRLSTFESVTPEQVEALRHVLRQKPRPVAAEQ
jgi:hypothetical protein